MLKVQNLPLKYYDIDAAIVFSDILMIPWAMNRNVKFTKNIGPTMDPMIPNETKIVKNINICKSLKPLENAIKILRKDIPFISMFNWFFRSTMDFSLLYDRGSKQQRFY